MTPLQTNNRDIVLVKLPKDASNILIEGNELYYRSEVWSLAAIGHLKKLPPGNYSIIGIASELTEDVAKGLVGWFYDFDGRKGYYNYLDDKKTLWNRADQSLHSLVRSHGEEPETTLIIEKI